MDVWKVSNPQYVLELRDGRFVRPALSKLFPRKVHPHAPEVPNESRSGTE